MKIGFVCTNYNNSAFTRAAVASLRSGTASSGIHIVVVDNKSTEADVAALREISADYPGVELVLNTENLGYFAGLNAGIRHLRKSQAPIDHIIVGNNDLVFPSDFAERLDRNADVFESWAVVAPDLVTPDGVHQNPHVLFPISRARRVIWNLHYLSYPIAAMVRFAASLTKRFTVRSENAPDSVLYKAAGPVEQGYGACYILGPLFFRHFEQLCAPTFLMQEEYFLFEQLQTIGQMTYYDPRFVVHHHGHATMHRLPSKRHWSLSREAHRVYNRYRALSPEDRLRFIAEHSRTVP